MAICIQSELSATLDKTDSFCLSAVMCIYVQAGMCWLPSELGDGAVDIQSVSSDLLCVHYLVKSQGLLREGLLFCTQ